MTNERILALAGEYGLAMGMHYPLQQVRISETHLGFRRPPGLTPHGESVIAFARAVLAEAAV